MKKICSILIVAVMLIGMLPAVAIPAFAEVTSGTTGALIDSLPLSFNACEKVTRGMICAFLADIFNYEGVELNGQLPFIDVPADYKYAKSIEWVCKIGISSGVTANTFAPEYTITRGQAVVYLCRTAERFGIELTEEKDYTQICVDISKDKYYTESANKCLNNNIMTAEEIDGELYFRPQDVVYFTDFAKIFDTFPDEHIDKEAYELLFSRGTDHIYTDDCDSSCDACNAQRNAPHVVDYDCDTECNICKSIRIAANHQYDNACDDECNVCKATRTIIHTYDDICDTECNICGQKRTVTHKYYAAFLADEAYHWLECAICQSKKNAGAHIYFNACDTTCNICNTPRTVAGHQYDHGCDADCNVCGATRTPAAHTGGTATCKEQAKCAVCGVAYGALGAHQFGDYLYNNDATTVADGTKTRTCSVCGAKDTVAAEGTKLENPFTDVKAGKYYVEPVLWAVEKEITKGLNDTTFGPDQACTRGHIVTFLWRAAGSPEPKSTTNPFTDVQEGKFYYKAVLWAVENGITKGLTDTTFGPGNTCNRGQVVAFLWRAAGCPEPQNSANPFTDVQEGKFYYKAVLWAVENGITKGLTATTFGPAKTCTRGQIVTFLYNTYK